jgi:hypothetical protein
LSIVPSSSRNMLQHHHLRMGLGRTSISMLCGSVPCCAALFHADRHLCARIVYGLLTDALKFDGSNQRWVCSAGSHMHAACAVCSVGCILFWHHWLLPLCRACGLADVGLYRQQHMLTWCTLLQMIECHLAAVNMQGAHAAPVGGQQSAQQAGGQQQQGRHLVPRQHRMGPPCLCLPLAAPSSGSSSSNRHTHVW